MSTVQEKESALRKVALNAKETGWEAVKSCILLGFEPSGRVAFAQVGDLERPADEQVTDTMLDRYPNLSHVALVPAQLVNVRSETHRVIRPK